MPENQFDLYSENKYDLLVKGVESHATILTAIVIFWARILDDS